MTDFRIFAHGKSFDADACAASSPLKFDRLWRRGEPKDCGGVYETAGVEIQLAAGQRLPFYSQADVALTFLRENEQELRAVGKFKGVETFILGIEREIESSPSLVGFSVSFPESLMSYALSGGVQLVAYVQLIRSGERSDA